MKKSFLLFAIAVCGVFSANAQYSDAHRTNSARSDNFRKTYVNLGYSALGKVTMDGVDTGNAYEGRFGAFMSVGQSFILHDEPVARMLRFGIDGTFLDLNYVYHKPKSDALTPAIHQAEAGLGVGPAIHVNPFAELGIHAYFRFNPSFSAMYVKYDSDTIDDTGYYGYATYFTTGAAVSWNLVSFGVEARWGKGANLHEWESDNKMKLDNSGIRAYFGFRF